MLNGGKVAAWMGCSTLQIGQNMLHYRKPTQNTIHHFRPVASSEALYVLAMHPASYCRIPMVIKMVSDLPAFFFLIDFVVVDNLRERPDYGQYEIKLC